MAPINYPSDLIPNGIDYDSDVGLFEEIERLSADQSKRLSFTNAPSLGPEFTKKLITAGNVLCCACNINDPGKLLTCSRCCSPFHLSCHYPPILTEQLTTKKKWLCNRCTCEVAANAPNKTQWKFKTPSDHDAMNLSAIKFFSDYFRSNSNNNNDDTTKNSKKCTVIAKRSEQIGVLDDCEEEGGTSASSSVAKMKLQRTLTDTALARKRKLTNEDEIAASDDHFYDRQVFDNLRKLSRITRVVNSTHFNLVPLNVPEEFYNLPFDDVVPRPLCEQPKRCFNCRRTLPEKDTIECDYCEAAFHLDCLDPPLTFDPKEKRYMCPLHVEYIVDRYFLNSQLITDRIALWKKHTELVRAPNNSSLFCLSPANFGGQKRREIEIKVEEGDEPEQKSSSASALLANLKQRKDESMSIERLGIHHSSQLQRRAERYSKVATSSSTSSCKPSKQQRPKPILSFLGVFEEEEETSPSSAVESASSHAASSAGEDDSGNEQGEKWCTQTAGESSASIVAHIRRSSNIVDPEATNHFTTSNKDTGIPSTFDHRYLLPGRPIIATLYIFSCASHSSPLTPFKFKPLPSLSAWEGFQQASHSSGAILVPIQDIMFTTLGIGEQFTVNLSEFTTDCGALRDFHVCIFFDRVLQRFEVIAERNTIDIEKWREQKLQEKKQRLKQHFASTQSRRYSTRKCNITPLALIGLEEEEEEDYECDHQKYDRINAPKCLCTGALFGDDIDEILDKDRWAAARRALERDGERIKKPVAKYASSAAFTSSTSIHQKQSNNSDSLLFEQRTCGIDDNDGDCDDDCPANVITPTIRKTQALHNDTLVKMGCVSFLFVQAF